MAFARSGWGTLGGQAFAGTLPALYIYSSTDAHTAIDASGYFSSLADTLVVGDMIIVHGATGGTRTVTMHVVVSNDGTTVDISDGTTVGAVSDSD